MSIRLVHRKARSKNNKKKPGGYYAKGRYKGKPIHKSLGTSDRTIAQDRFAAYLAKLTAQETIGTKGVANFAAAIVAYYDELRRNGREENSNTPWLDEMLPLVGKAMRTHSSRSRSARQNHAAEGFR